MRTAMPAVALAALLAAQSSTPRDRAEAAAAELGQTIRALLSEELAAGGFEGAARACSEKAQPATRDFAKARGIDIRRVSLKPRHPDDAPDAWEAAQLRRIESDLRAGKALPAFIEETIEHGMVYRYLKPITIQAMCLSCHGSGDEIPAGVRRVLAGRYPADAATGYKAGDLRGAFSVKIPR